MKTAATIIWKRSASVHLIGRTATAKKIGGALFPRLALRIRQFVTLRLSKAPITVCGVDFKSTPPAGKTFPVIVRGSLTDQLRSGSLLVRKKWIFRFAADSGRGASRAALQAAQPAVYQPPDGAQVASPQSPILAGAS
jgi:hypothetical protein